MQGPDFLLKSCISLGKSFFGQNSIFQVTEKPGGHLRVHPRASKAPSALEPAGPRARSRRWARLRPWHLRRWKHEVDDQRPVGLQMGQQLGTWRQLPRSRRKVSRPCDGAVKFAESRHQNNELSGSHVRPAQASSSWCVGFVRVSNTFGCFFFIQDRDSNPMPASLRALCYWKLLIYFGSRVSAPDQGSVLYNSTDP